MIGKELSDLIKKTGGRYIIVEKDKPEYVVMSWKDYQSMAAADSEVKLLTEEELIDKINKDISLWREGQDQGNFEIDEIEELEDIEYV